GVDTQTDRITAEVRALLLESLPPPAPGTPAPRPPVPWGWIVASAALAIAFLSTALWWRSVNQLNQVTSELSDLRSAVADEQVAVAALTAALPGGSRKGAPLAESV